MRLKLTYTLINHPLEANIGIRVHKTGGGTVLKLEEKDFIP